MALNTHYFSFNQATSTGVTTIVTGLGFQAKALILWTNAHTGAGFTTHHAIGYGFSDGTDDYSIFAQHPDAATTVSGQRHAAKVVTIINTANTLVAEAEVSSFEADGSIDIDWTTADASARIIHGIAIGGDDLTNAKVGNFLSDAATGDQTVSGLGFTPSLVLFASSGNTSAAPSTGTTFWAWGIGGMNGTQEWGYSHTGFPFFFFVWITSSARIQDTDACILGTDGGVSGVGNIVAEANFSAFNSGEFVITWVTVPSTQTYFGYLALGGTFQSKLGADTQPTTASSKTTSGLGFTPTGLLLGTFNNVATTSVVASGRNTVGGASAAGVEGHVWAGTGDDTQQSDRRSNVGKAIGMIDANSPSAAAAEADVTAFNSGEFTLDWTTADATARQFVYLALGNAPVAGGALITPLRTLLGVGL